MIKQKKYVLVIFITIVILLIMIFYKPEKKEVLAQDNIIKNGLIEEKPKKEDITTIKVDIKGAVNKPGVYKMDSNSRVIDVLNKAEGISKNGDTRFINLSKKLTDEMVIIIYTKEETETIKEGNKKIEYIEIEKECLCNEASIVDCENNNIERKISINNASLEQLQTLPGIGLSKAEAIIEYRTSNSFNTLEDIMNVPGIGESIYDKIKNHITL
ncbi:MAG: helix-hairpin-helix domain-containing protein [Bacilli bacterium]